VSSGAICGGGFPLRTIGQCPTEERRRRIVGLDGGWWGVTWTCCGCGDSWQEDEYLPRPFERGWRQKAIAKARRHWADAGRYTRAQHMEWRMAQ
jgi:hypothetical protein